MLKGDLIVVFKAWNRSFEIGVFIEETIKSIFYIPVNINTDYYLKNSFRNRISSKYKENRVWKITEDNKGVDKEKLIKIRNKIL